MVPNVGLSFGCTRLSTRSVILRYKTDGPSGGCYRRVSRRLAHSIPCPMMGNVSASAM